LAIRKNTLTGTHVVDVVSDRGAEAVGAGAGVAAAGAAVVAVAAVGAAAAVGLAAPKTEAEGVEVVAAADDPNAGKPVDGVAAAAAVVVVATVGFSPNVIPEEDQVLKARHRVWD